MLNRGTEAPANAPHGAGPDTAMPDVAHKKFSALKKELSRMGSVLVAFSGGVDSTFLLKAATDELGPEKAAALTATSPTYPEREFGEACSLAASIGARHIVVDSNELEIPNFSDNSPRRCYYCKTELFTVASRVAREHRLAYVLDGSNADDTADYRPGRQAAAELGVVSPLQDAGLTKDEIRLLSRELGLPTWNKPSFACLSSRFPYGTKITGERLSKVGQGEEALRSMGFVQFRVRYHGDTARIEVAPADVGAFFDPALRDKVVAAFKEIGFIYVTLDLEGYRTGSMNEAIERE